MSMQREKRKTDDSYRFQSKIPKMEDTMQRDEEKTEDNLEKRIFDIAIEIEKVKAKIAEATKEIETATKELETAKKELVPAKKELATAKNDLEKAEEKLVGKSLVADLTSCIVSMSNIVVMKQEQLMSDTAVMKLLKGSLDVMNDKLEELKNSRLVMYFLEKIEDPDPERQKRVFYLVELQKPRRIHFYHTDEYRAKYPLNLLSGLFAPTKETETEVEEEEEMTGEYVRILRRPHSEVYFFSFAKTQPASLTTTFPIEFEPRHADEIIPRVENFLIFCVPSYWGYATDLKEAMETLVEQSNETLEKTITVKLNAMKTGETVQVFASEVLLQCEKERLMNSETMKEKLLKNTFRIPELRNGTLVRFLKDNFSTDFAVHCDGTLPKQQHNISKYSNSKPDFYLELKNLHLRSGKVIAGITAVVASEVVPESEVVEIDCVDVGGITGDCKRKPTGCDRCQVVANMMKLAGDVANKLVTLARIFDIIVVYGLLVDYDKEVATPYQLNLDFKNQISTVYESEGSLPIGEAFSRTVASLHELENFSKVVNSLKF